MADLRGQYGGTDGPCYRPESTGVGEWCAPGPAAEQRQTWVLLFEDKDRGMSTFYDAEEARSAFATAEAYGWNCHLLVHVPRVTPNVKFSGGAPLFGAASAGTQGSASDGPEKGSANE